MQAKVPTRRTSPLKWVLTVRKRKLAQEGRTSVIPLKRIKLGKYGLTPRKRTSEGKHGRRDGN